jgi:hypothetical protein
MSGPGLNRIDVRVAGSSAQVLADRDKMISQAMAGFPGAWDYYHYTDTRSGLGTWAYQAIGFSIVAGVATVATVSCSGMAIPPTGSNLAAKPDPGVGTTFAWTPVGAPLTIRTSADAQAGGSPPSQNNYLWVWKVSPNSLYPLIDFASGINSLAPLVGGATRVSCWRYIDSISGAWSVYAIGSTIPSTPGETPMFIMVTCSGTPNPPSGSQYPAVAYPPFPQAFTDLFCPFNFGPSR